MRLSPQTGYGEPPLFLSSGPILGELPTYEHADILITPITITQLGASTEIDAFNPDLRREF